MSTDTHCTAPLFVAPAEQAELPTVDLFTIVAPFTHTATADTTAGYEVLLGDGVPVMRCTRCGAHIVLPPSEDPDLDVELPARMYHYNPCGKANPMSSKRGAL